MAGKEKKQPQKINRQTISQISSMDTTNLHISNSYNRKNYVDKRKMSETKEKAYTNSEGHTVKTMVDPYTGEVLHRNRDAALSKYGEKRNTYHSSQTDHTVPLEHIYNRHKNSAWLTDDDIKDVANSQFNLKEISTHANEQKRSDSNVEYVINHWNEMSSSERIKRLTDGVKSDVSVEAKLSVKKVNNIGKTAVDGAKNVLTGAAPSLIHQGAKNISKVANGEIEVEDAVKDMGDKVSGTIVTGMAANVIKHQVEHTADRISQKVIHKTLDMNAVGKVTGIVMSLQDCTNRFVSGEISGGEYCIEVLEDGMGFVVSEIGFMVGGILGGPFCAACCSYVLSTTYDSLVSLMRDGRISKKKQLEMNDIAIRIREEQEAYRKGFEEAFSNYYKTREYFIESAYTGLISSIKRNDVNGFLDEINRMGETFGIQYTLGSFDDIDKKMQDEDFVFVL